MVESRFVIQGIYGDPGIAALTWDIVGEVSSGSGGFVNHLFDDYIAWEGAASYSATGTWQCDGYACEYLALPEGVPMPYAEMLTFMGMEPIDSVFLGSWLIDGLIPTRFEVDCFAFLPGSCHTRGENAFAVASGLDAYGYPTMIALHVEGEAIPEPATAWLAATALLALALRRGLSGTMRRHEVA